MSRKSPEYYRNHRKLYVARGKASEHTCARCKKHQAQSWSQRHGTAGDRPSHYRPLCWTCHQKYDSHWNSQTRKKVSKSSKQRWSDPAYKKRVGERISEAKMGHSVSPETREKIGRAKVGNQFAAGKRTPEQCERIRIGRWGGDA